MWVNVCRGSGPAASSTFKFVVNGSGVLKFLPTFFTRTSISWRDKWKIWDGFGELRALKLPEFSTLALRNADLRPGTKWTTQTYETF